MAEFHRDRLNDSDRGTVAQIIDILAEETALDRDLLQDDASLESLGVASIDLMQSIFALETRFDIEIPQMTQNAGAEFATAGDLIALTLATIKTTRRAAVQPPAIPLNADAI